MSASFSPPPALCGHFTASYKKIHAVGAAVLPHYKDLSHSKRRSTWTTVEINDNSCGKSSLSTCSCHLRPSYLVFCLSGPRLVQTEQRCRDDPELSLFFLPTPIRPSLSLLASPSLLPFRDGRLHKDR